MTWQFYEVRVLEKRLISMHYLSALKEPTRCMNAPKESGISNFTENVSVGAEPGVRGGARG